MEFTVRITLGDLFINNEFVAQICWDAESVGFAITNYLIENGYPSCEN